MSARVALISEHASPLAILGGVDSGGQNIYVGQLAAHLAGLGYAVDVLTRRDDERLPETVEWARGVTVVHVPAGPPAGIIKEELLPFMPEFTDGVLRRIRRDGAYDLIHANFWMSGLVAAELKRALGIPFAVTFHALGRVRRRHQGDADHFPDARFAIEDRVVAEADAVIAECPQDRDDLIELYHADPSRIAVIPCGFDPAEMWPVDPVEARRSLGLADERIVLQLGRLVPRKGVDNVIRGFARLRGRGVECRLLIVGGESNDPDPRLTPEIGRLAEIARAEGVEDGVTFVGRRGRDVLRLYYSAADVFVTTPHYEPFGITPLEAMACGTPVIGSAVGGIKFSVRDGETGLLVPPGNADALGEQLARLFARPSLRRALGARAQTWVNERFTWARVAQGVSALYEDVLARVPARARAAGSAAAPDDALATIDRAFDAAVRTLEDARRRLPGVIREAAELLAGCFLHDGKLLICGNGGSAADAQHFAGELVGRFKAPGRAALPALALCADQAVVTAWANDVGYDAVFARQVEAFGRPGDVLVGISTSGRSRNVVRAFEAARAQGLRTVALVGGDGGDVMPLADTTVVVPSSDTQHIQEAQILIIHVLCELVEGRLAAASRSSAERAERR
jgi:D-inositol-3-phosphate glycosyltransferase